jgi:class 3 adenylate cyclase
VLFVDIDSSATLSRRLPTRAYFELIRAVTTAVDDMVAERRGIVGKHAGDGASAFFLASDLGGDSAAARVCLDMARELPHAVRDAVGRLSAGGIAVDPDRCRINVGAHWGANLYMGQVVTGGRLEVTALGDEVNETARIEQVATGGEALASKTLLERLDADDAAALGLEPGSRSYELVSDRVGQENKAWRDAGALAVTRLEPYVRD